MLRVVIHGGRKQLQVLVHRDVNGMMSRRVAVGRFVVFQTSETPSRSTPRIEFDRLDSRVEQRHCGELPQCCRNDRLRSRYDQELRRLFQLLQQ
jgi:hypothetical protein